MHADFHYTGTTAALMVSQRCWSALSAEQVNALQLFRLSIVSHFVPCMLYSVLGRL